jgi:hypothetical protein
MPIKNTMYPNMLMILLLMLHLLKYPPAASLLPAEDNRRLLRILPAGNEMPG